jgi:hypothetical protein
MKKFTIITLALALTAVFAVTAMANEWNLYGSARMETFYKSEDLVTDDTFGRGNDGDLTWRFQNNSRVGASVKGDMLEARFEYGARPARRDNGAVTNFANVRRLYGVWKFTEGWGLKVGKDYTPITFFLSGQVVDADAGLLFVGNAYGGRKGLVALEGMGFKIALIAPATGLTLPGGFDTGLGFTVASDVETTFPKLEVSYQFKFSDAMSAHAFGGYQTYKQLFKATDAAGVVVSNIDESIASWIVGVGADLNFGPMFVKPQVSYYANGASAGWLLSTLGGGGTALPNINAQGNLNDVNSLMAMLALGFSPTENLTLEAGIGYLYTDADNNFENSAYDVYAQAVLQLAPGVFIVPEAGWRDFGDRELVAGQQKIDLGSQWYAGAKWQINF